MPSPCSFKRRPGLSHLDVLLAMVVVVVVAAPLSMVAAQGVRGRSVTQEELFVQQDMAQILSTFSKDVRSASGMTEALSDRFTLSHLSGATPVYTSYRIASGRLQRGQSTKADVAPTTWRDVVDGDRFKVSKGAFTYYQWGNTSGASSKLFRRIEIANLQFENNRSQNKIDAPSISAVMREGANARALVLVGPPTWRAANGNLVDPEAAEDDEDSKKTSNCGPSNPSALDAMFSLFKVKNISRSTIEVSAFTGAWSKTDNKIESFTMDPGKKITWGNGKAEIWPGATPVSMPSKVVIPAGGTADVKVFFKMGSKLESFALKLYDATDTTRTSPYVLQIL
jgi:hypothetical protein